MGQIYSKMGKNDLSLVYYQEAQKLNPSNAVLLYLVGTVRTVVFCFVCPTKTNIVPMITGTRSEQPHHPPHFCHMGMSVLKLKLKEKDNQESMPAYQH